jgi:hypothetical protein
VSGLRRGVLLALVLLLTAAGRLPAATAPVSYLSGASVYVDAGAREGLAVGDTLSILRGGREIARVRVTFTSSHRAACDTLWTGTPVEIGDVVRYVAAVPKTPAADTSGYAPPAPDPTGVPAPKPSASRARLRGRVGAGWLSVATSDGGSFRQPSLALRFDGTGLNGGRTDLAFDMRSRRTTRDFAGSGSTVENVGRVYRAALTMRAADPGKRLVLGRQSSTALTSVNLFDGVLLELADASHSFGMFAGTQPEIRRFGFSSDIVQGGAFFEFHQPPRSVARWSVAVGGVTSLDHGHPNRDFAFAQGWWFSKAFTASLTQEIDLNHSWKRVNGEPMLTATSTFATASAPVTSWFTLNGGYDNRRNVRLYRDRLTPETEFDDAFRQGAWVGAQFSALSHLRLGGDTRVNEGAGRAESWSLHAEAWRFTRMNASLRGRYSRYTDDQQDSRLQSFGLGFEPLRVARVDVSGGVRSTKNARFGVDDHEHWVSVDTDVTIGRNWYMGAGWESDRGEHGDTKQLQASLNRRF